MMQGVGWRGMVTTWCTAHGVAWCHVLLSAAHQWLHMLRWFLPPPRSLHAFTQLTPLLP